MSLEGQTPAPAVPGDDALEHLAARVAAEGPPLAVTTVQPTVGSAFGILAAAGPHTKSDPAAYAFVVEAVREGYLCHYESSRILDNPDPDLALLAGDLFYAIGISALAELEDTESVRVLSDLIRAAADLRAEGGRQRAEVMWVAGVLALSCGSDADYESLRLALSKGEEGALEALESWSGDRANANGLGRNLSEVREAIHFASDT